MSAVDTGGPAFPALEPWGSKKQEFTAIAASEATLRDYFAAKAMQGICASGPTADWTDKHISTAAYTMADAMLEARK